MELKKEKKDYLNTSIRNHYHHSTDTSNSHDAKRHRSVSLAGGFMGGINRSEFPQKSERTEVIKAYLEIPGILRDTINNLIRRVRFKGYQSN